MTQLSLVTISDLMSQSGVAFGTSGARGPVVAMTDAVCFTYTVGFLQHMATMGEFSPGMQVAIAGDLRPSTPRILMACATAIEAQGGIPLFCGYVPSPALALHAFSLGIPSIMVTGSHIPDDRNGIKFNRIAGEILKSDETGMKAQQVEVPAALFDEAGNLRQPKPLKAPAHITNTYVQRYVDFFGSSALAGMRVGVYQHSAVGRDILVELCEALGAEVEILGRSTTFIPVDTEAVRSEDVALARQWAAEHRLDAILSTDGDSDRPLIADEHGKWLRGDVLGILCARYLGAQCVATPVSSNTALEKCGWFEHTARTRIGSPYVIEAMEIALKRGRHAVCGYEANGGFLLMSAMQIANREIGPLPTRDAVLPMLAVLADARVKVCPLSVLLETLPAQFTFSDRIQNFPTALSQKHLTSLQQGNEAGPFQAFEQLFGKVSGRVIELDATDGLRATFANGEVIHLRPSGNAPELRCYTEAMSEQRAVQINGAALDIIASWRK